MELFECRGWIRPLVKDVKRTVLVVRKVRNTDVLTGVERDGQKSDHKRVISEPSNKDERVVDTRSNPILLVGRRGRSSDVGVEGIPLHLTS